MRLFDRLAKPEVYRPASLVLLALAFALPAAVVALGGARWLGVVLLGWPLFIVLAVATYHRLRDAGLSGRWVILLVIVCNVGPEWVAPWGMTFYLGNLIHLIPLIMCWVAPSKSAPALAATG